VLFTGAHEHSVDAKHRLAIPAAVRNQLRSAGSADALYIHVGANGALWLWPEPTFEKMAGDVEPSLSPDPELQEFDELTFPDTHRAEFDSAGRVTIPDQMLAEAGASINATATSEIYAEGLVIPPVRIVQETRAHSSSGAVFMTSYSVIASFPAGASTTAILCR